MLGLYAARDYLDAHSPLRKHEDLRSQCFINYVDELLYSKMHYLAEVCGSTRVVLRSTSIVDDSLATPPVPE